MSYQANLGVYRLNQLPYLDHKAEYLWGNVQVMDVTDHKVDVINIDDRNTVATLRTQLSRVFSLGSLDGGFPIVTKADLSHPGSGGLKMIGYISHNELEHALSTCLLPCCVESRSDGYYFPTQT
jgi:chloride channel 3/4/5